MTGTEFDKVRLFKYLSPEGAKKMLSTGTIRLSDPSTFNDPFDMRLDETLGLDFRQFAEQQKTALFDMLSGDVDTGSLRSSELGKKAALINEAMRRATPEQKKTIKDGLMATPLEDLYDFESMKGAQEELLNMLKDGMCRYGVFCMARRHDSLLMWSHYTNHHKGAVLEFAPDRDKDSALCASRPVRYAKERPLVYRTASDLVRRGLTMAAVEAAGEILDDLIFTKSVEWEYEQEFRLAIPDFIQAGNVFQTMTLGPREFVAVYLGCRMDETDKRQLMELAQALNDSIEIYQAHVSPREYELIFEPVGAS